MENSFRSICNCWERSASVRAYKTLQSLKSNPFCNEGLISISQPTLMFSPYSPVSLFSPLRVAYSNLPSMHFVLSFSLRYLRLTWSMKPLVAVWLFMEFFFKKMNYPLKYLIAASLRWSYLLLLTHESLYQISFSAFQFHLTATRSFFNSASVYTYFLFLFREPRCCLGGGSLAFTHVIGSPYSPFLSRYLYRPGLPSAMVGSMRYHLVFFWSLA